MFCHPPKRVKLSCLQQQTLAQRAVCNHMHTVLQLQNTRYGRCTVSGSLGYDEEGGYCTCRWIIVPWKLFCKRVVDLGSIPSKMPIKNIVYPDVRWLVPIQDCGRTFECDYYPFGLAKSRMCLERTVKIRYYMYTRLEMFNAHGTRHSSLFQWNENPRRGAEVEHFKV